MQDHALDQLGQAVAHELLDLFLWKGRDSVVLQHPVGGCGNVRKAVHQRPVQIEHDCRAHRQSRQFEVPAQDLSRLIFGAITLVWRFCQNRLDIPD